LTFSQSIQQPLEEENIADFKDFNEISAHETNPLASFMKSQMPPQPRRSTQKQSHIRSISGGSESPGHNRSFVIPDENEKFNNQYLE
jgi:hypothetical protein